MKKYYIYILVMFVAIFTFNINASADTEALICDYEGTNFNARLRIFTDKGMDLNVSDFRHADSTTNLDDDIPLNLFYNWKTSTWNGKDFQYSGLADYENNGKCPPYMVYIFLGNTQTCLANCTRIFVADTTAKAGEIIKYIKDNNIYSEYEPIIFVQGLSKSTVPNSSNVNIPYTDPSTGKETVKGCSIFPDEITEVLNKVLNIFRFLAPILLLVFSSFDFLKATTAGDKDALKTAGIRLIKRLVICVALFFVPTLINILLELFGNMAGTCGVK